MAITNKTFSVKNGLDVANTIVIDSSRNLSNIATINATTINANTVLTSTGINVSAAALNSYSAANSAANTTAVSANSGSTLTGKQLNFINTASVQVSVVAGADGTNANISFTSTGGGGGGSGNANVTVSTTAPGSPRANQDFWWDASAGTLRIYYNDGTSSQWVDAVSGVIGPSGPSGPSQDLTSISSNLIPSANVTYNIGSPTNRWKDLYLSNSTIYLGAASLSACGTSLILPAGTTVSGAGGITTISSQATAPSSPNNGDQWYNTSTGVLFEYINDGDSSQWVDISSIAYTATSSLANLTDVTITSAANNQILTYNSTSTKWVNTNNVTSANIINYTEGVVAIGTVTTSYTFNLTNGTVQTATLTASTACTFTMPTAVAGKSFVLYLKQAASTGNGTATFTGVKWPTAGAPTITATAGKMDIISFVSDGTNWYGSYTQGYTP